MDEKKDNRKLVPILNYIDSHINMIIIIVKQHILLSPMLQSMHVLYRDVRGVNIDN